MALSRVQYPRSEIERSHQTPNCRQNIANNERKPYWNHFHSRLLVVLFILLINLFDGLEICHSFLFLLFSLPCLFCSPLTYQLLLLVSQKQKSLLSVLCFRREKTGKGRVWTKRNWISGKEKLNKHQQQKIFSVLRWKCSSRNVNDVIQTQVPWVKNDEKAIFSSKPIDLQARHAPLVPEHGEEIGGWIRYIFYTWQNKIATQGRKPKKKKKKISPPKQLYP